MTSDPAHVGSPPEPLLDVTQVAAWLSVPTSTVYSLNKGGKLTGRLVGRHLRYRRQDVQDYIDNPPAQQPGGPGGHRSSPSGRPGHSSKNHP